ncbi:MetQ/NlpA family ABC transporter substrate-binding protein [Rothia sp. P6271]|uniref:MetQ/NlpA family ABC transporter substrate-binding protein n=1 Tax=unclassified Rothia (in: high G+C Gram-positive bacteria) TaxID=2689056 RepID=UPI003AC384D3
MKKFVATLALLPLAFGLSACGSTQTPAEDNKITIGVVGADPVNEKLKEVAADKGIDIEYKEFTDYTQPNPALHNGDIDLNWFQHIAYLSNYNVEANDNLQIVGPTVIYPMALFSKKHTSVADIPQGAEIAIPNDTVNEARALLLLKKNNLVTFTSDDVKNPSVDNVDTAQSKVKITPVDAAQTVLSLESVDASVINNDFIRDAKLNPKDALAQDDPADDSAKPYVNLFVAKADNADNEKYKEIVKLFHTPEVQAVVQEDTEGTAVEVNTDVKDLREALKKAEDEKRQS